MNTVLVLAICPLFALAVHEHYHPEFAETASKHKSQLHGSQNGNEKIFNPELGEFPSHPGQSEHENENGSHHEIQVGNGSYVRFPKGKGAKDGKESKGTQVN